VIKDLILIERAVLQYKNGSTFSSISSSYNNTCSFSSSDNSSYSVDSASIGAASATDETDETTSETTTTDRGHEIKFGDCIIVYINGIPAPRYESDRAVPPSYAFLLQSFHRLIDSGRAAVSFTSFLNIYRYILKRSPTDNWGFTLESCWGYYTSWEMPKIGECPELEDEQLQVLESLL